MNCWGRLKSLSLDYRSKMPQATFVLDANVEDIENLKDVLLDMDVKKHRAKRSLDANAYYWVLCTQIAKVLGQSNAWVHNRMLRKYGQIEIIDGQAIYLVLPDSEAAERQVDESETYHVKPTEQVQEGKHGLMYRTYLMLRGSHEYNTDEMSQLIDGVVYEAKELGIDTVTDKRLKEMLLRYEEQYKKHHSG